MKVHDLIKVAYDECNNSWELAEIYDVVVSEENKYSLMAKLAIVGVEYLSGYRYLLKTVECDDFSIKIYGVYILDSLSLMLETSVAVSSVCAIEIEQLSKVSYYFSLPSDFVYACILNKSLLDYFLSNLVLKLDISDNEFIIFGRF